MTLIPQWPCPYIEGAVSPITTAKLGFPFKALLLFIVDKLLGFEYGVWTSGF